MLIDTHCHINMMIKKTFDTPLEKSDLPNAQTILEQAQKENVSIIINVGTRSIENSNCILLAQTFNAIFATVGIHPNDSDTWQEDFILLKKWLLKKTENKIVGIGECGIDFHYPDYNFNRQRDAFKAQIELALEHDLALIIHSRDAYDETLRIVEEYKNNLTRTVMHCFSYDQSFAATVTDWRFMLGIGGTITYPKNNILRDIVQSIDIKNIVLETDAPFLPPQSIRGKQNHPKEIATIAHFIAELRGESFENIAKQTTKNALTLFNLHDVYMRMHSN
ncbi:MAG TPA: TatD family hydrolase [Candidatus Babeliales bacterium]|nr:TatD family hydrolase [Candidatus Babeliales bacterium]